MSLTKVHQSCSGTDTFLHLVQPAVEEGVAVHEQQVIVRILPVQIVNRHDLDTEKILVLSSPLVHLLVGQRHHLHLRPAIVFRTVSKDNDAILLRHLPLESADGKIRFDMVA